MTKMYLLTLDYPALPGEPEEGADDTGIDVGQRLFWR